MTTFVDTIPDVLLSVPCGQVDRIHARRIVASMHNYEILRDPPNELPKRKPMSEELRTTRIRPKPTVPMISTCPRPDPAITFWTLPNLLPKSIQCVQSEFPDRFWLSNIQIRNLYPVHGGRTPDNRSKGRACESPRKTQIRPDINQTRHGEKTRNETSAR